jgi:hypothetical protein
VTLHLLRDSPSLTRPAYVEADLAAMFDEGRFSDFAAFWLFLHASRWPQSPEAQRDCVLELWQADAQATGERALERLRDGVKEALRSLGTGFVTYPENVALREALKSGTLTVPTFFQELLRLVYRFIFLLTTEDRDLLHLPGADAGPRRSTPRDTVQDSCATGPGDGATMTSTPISGTRSKSASKGWRRVVRPWPCRPWAGSSIRGNATISMQASSTTTTSCEPSMP